METPIIYWFRQDLRVEDLPGLNAAVATGRPLLLCYILDDLTPGDDAPGGASRWWLHHSLAALARDIEALGGRLLLRRGAARDVLCELAGESGAGDVYCSRCYEPWAADLEHSLFDTLGSAGVNFKRFPGSLLFEPESLLNKSGQPFRVFTPFWKACLRQPAPALPRSLPAAPRFLAHPPDTVTLESLSLLPRNPDWAEDWPALWRPGTAGARQALQRFLDGPIGDYDEGRNHPAKSATSRLSPHMHFGELSPRQLWHAVQAHCVAQPSLSHQQDKFLSELGWREFSHHLLLHFPHIVHSPFRESFAAFPWLGDDAALRAWQRGQTGYPIVDAGMRELWATGYMHNRVRMITASFLTKHLLIPWQRGERWFRDTLVDADVANNACGWQWVAGSGADAAPYFRIFNPTLQGQKFDAQGDYVRQWVPELARLPAKYIHEPSAAPADVLAAAGLVPGETYPLPVVEHRAAREAALAAYASIRQRTG